MTCRFEGPGSAIGTAGAHAIRRGFLAFLGSCLFAGCCFSPDDQTKERIARDLLPESIEAYARWPGIEVVFVEFDSGDPPQTLLDALQARTSCPLLPASRSANRPDTEPEGASVDRVTGKRGVVVGISRFECRPEDRVAARLTHYLARHWRGDLDAEFEECKGVWAMRSMELLVYWRGFYGGWNDGTIHFGLLNREAPDAPDVWPIDGDKRPGCGANSRGKQRASSDSP